MQRIPLNPRENWQQKVESLGLTFHTLENGTPYWDESAAYQFTAAEIDTLEAAGYTLQEMCLAAAQHIIVIRQATVNARIGSPFLQHSSDDRWSRIIADG